MTGGNQRELARQKNAKKHTEQTKGKRNEDGLSAAARKQSTLCNKYSQRKRWPLQSMSKNVSFHASVKTLDSRYATPSWKHFTQVELPDIHRIYRICYIFVIYIVIG
uniref:Small EDRK-rich factor-like N-terminal domain-containing protein n=1 Tax=Oreochromis niloticus TaxID=8128 RepID=A0A669DRE5_ORENI